jgi:(p)ppGpp synthase/HD superfamily hydrolase
MIRHYSPRLREATEFASARHDGQRRKAAPVPMFSHVCNVALMLALYRCDEDTVIGGLFHDVIEDCVSEEWPEARLVGHIGDRFGPHVLETVLDVTEVKRDPATGEKLPVGVRRAAYLARLERATERGLLVCAADKIDNTESLLASLRGRPHDEVWALFSAGRDGTLDYLIAAAALLDRRLSHPIVVELGHSIGRLRAEVGR